MAWLGNIFGSRFRTPMFTHCSVFRTNQKFVADKWYKIVIGRPSQMAREASVCRPHSSAPSFGAHGELARTLAPAFALLVIWLFFPDRLDFYSLSISNLLSLPKHLPWSTAWLLNVPARTERMIPNRLFRKRRGTRACFFIKHFFLWNFIF